MDDFNKMGLRSQPIDRSMRQILTGALFRPAMPQDGPVYNPLQ
jgi:hypothetical protein